MFILISFSIVDIMFQYWRSVCYTVKWKSTKILVPPPQQTLVNLVTIVVT